MSIVRSRVPRIVEPLPWRRMLKSMGSGMVGGCFDGFPWPSGEDWTEVAQAVTTRGIPWSASND